MSRTLYIDSAGLTKKLKLTGDSEILTKEEEDKLKIINIDREFKAINKMLQRDVYSLFNKNFSYIPTILVDIILGYSHQIKDHIYFDECLDYKYICWYERYGDLEYKAITQRNEPGLELLDDYLKEKKFCDITLISIDYIIFNFLVKWSNLASLYNLQNIIFFMREYSDSDESVDSIKKIHNCLFITPKEISQSDLNFLRSQVNPDCDVLVQTIEAYPKPVQPKLATPIPEPLLLEAPELMAEYVRLYCSTLFLALFPGAALAQSSPGLKNNFKKVLERCRKEKGVINIIGQDDKALASFMLSDKTCEKFASLALVIGEPQIRRDETNKNVFYVQHYWLSEIDRCGASISEIPKILNISESEFREKNNLRQPEEKPAIKAINAQGDKESPVLTTPTPTADVISGLSPIFTIPPEQAFYKTRSSKRENPELISKKTPLGDEKEGSKSKERDKLKETILAPQSASKLFSQPSTDEKPRLSSFWGRCLGGCLNRISRRICQTGTALMK